MNTKHRTPRHSSFGKPVIVFHRDGTKVNEFPSRAQCARHFETTNSYILILLKTKRYFYKKFYLVDKEEYDPKTFKLPPYSYGEGRGGHTIPTVVLDLAGNLLKEFPSLGDASKHYGLGRRDYLSQNVRNSRIFKGKYIVAYKKDYEAGKIDMTQAVKRAEVLKRQEEIEKMRDHREATKDERFIVIYEKGYVVEEVWEGLAKDLAKRDGIKELTMRAMLANFKRGRHHLSAITRLGYAYQKDFKDFLKEKKKFTKNNIL